MADCLIKGGEAHRAWMHPAGEPSSARCVIPAASRRTEHQSRRHTGSGERGPAGCRNEVGMKGRLFPHRVQLPMEVGEGQ